MAFLPFGSKKSRIKKLIEDDRFDEVVSMALKDGKTIKALIELLDDPVPGVRGDALVLIATVLKQEEGAIKPYLGEIFARAFELTESRNPYVRENAMMLSYELTRRFPEELVRLKDSALKTLMEDLMEGDKHTKGFVLVLIGRLGKEAKAFLNDEEIKELRSHVEEFVNVEDRVILPLEGYKWVPLGDIARETLEKLS
ncbi:hypothetical protein A3L12_05600 [Thermococcus sp. P6]|nr:hypothetical protein A3L12_05600 [Thermococcus sp. P6]